jgi:hypothetical protein
MAAARRSAVSRTPAGCGCREKIGLVLFIAAASLPEREARQAAKKERGRGGENEGLLGLQTHPPSLRLSLFLSSLGG